MRSFLAPLTDPAAGRMVLLNTRTGTVIADRLIPAFDSASRRRGLLEHVSLQPGEAMIIAPTSAVHTFLMQFDIDIAFVDRGGRILKICEAVRPWRLAAAWRAFAAIEMSAAAFASKVQPGDNVVCLPNHRFGITCADRDPEAR
jgi:uncharacterized membrane protein (UPF0127 family)